MPGTDEASTISSRWDEVLYQLSAQPRRQIIRSLTDVPADRRLSLPEAAFPALGSADRDQFVIELKHHHLPMLADAGYVRWERDPFSVRRGSQFEEPEAVMRLLLESTDDLPESLSRGGVIGAYGE